MEVLHDSPFVGHVGSVLDVDGAIARVAVLKATFDCAKDGVLTVAEEQEPVRHAVVYRGEPGRSSLLHESDGAYYKPATDILVVGSAHAPRGVPVTRLETFLSAGAVNKTVIVTGDRRWSWSRSSGAAPSPPEPFTEMPLVWERAFGGADTFGSDPAQHQWDARNPVGTGFRATESAALDGLALPNIEDPREPMNRWNQRPAPQGFGPIDRSWQPRIRHAGTYDKAWQTSRMPIPPLDFDYRYFQAASPDLQHSPHLQGGETVVALNLSSRADERFRLPRMQITFQGVARRRRFTIAGILDTVVLMFDAAKVVLVWRAKFRALVNEPMEPVTATIRRVG
jgi:hypothetical protein